MSRMSSALSDLPFDILPLIVQYIVRPNHLSQLCLVNKVFHLYATIELYNHPTIFAWHKGSKENVCLSTEMSLVFRSLTLHHRRGDCSPLWMILLILPVM